MGMCLGWQKVVPAPALDIPKRYHSKAIHIGYVMTAFIGLIYASFPIYTHLYPLNGTDIDGWGKVGSEELWPTQLTHEPKISGVAVTTGCFGGVIAFTPCVRLRSHCRRVVAQ